MNSDQRLLRRKIIFLVNVDWFFISHRIPIAFEAMRRGWEVHLVSAITDRTQELEKAGLIVHPLKLERAGLGIFNAVFAMWQMWKIFRLIQPDVVHAVTIKPVLLGGIVAQVAGVPAFVSAVPGLGSVFIAQGFMAGMRRKFVREAYRVAFLHKNKKIIFQNSGDRKIMAKMIDIKEQEIEMIRGSGVDLLKFSPAPWPTGIPIVVLAARLLWNKGVREFILAAKLVNEHDICARFVLVGTPDIASPTSVEMRQLQSWVEEGLVEWWGHRADMEEVLADASIVVLPSYSEGIPKILIEAAACGRPVVTTDVAGCREAIEVDVTGVLVPCRDGVALAHAIKGLLDDPERCKAMGARGRELAERHFDVNEVARRHLTIYEELVARA